MPKNKKDRSKKKAAKANKRKRQLKARAAKQVAPRPEIASFAESIQYPWWVAHGLNYFASDYEAGTWTPIFPNLYEGGGGVPTRNAAVSVVQDRFKEGGELSERGKILLAWTYTPPAGVFGVRAGLAAFLKKRGKPDLQGVEPHDPDVWSYFESLRSEILRRAHRN